jgi:hypothetical protein
MVATVILYSILNSFWDHKCVEWCEKGFMKAEYNPSVQGLHFRLNIADTKEFLN